MERVGSERVPALEAGLEWLDRVPAGLPLALVVPRPAATLSRFLDEWTTAHRAVPGLIPRRPPAVEGVPLDPWSPTALERLGLDPARPLVVVPGEPGMASAVVLGLSDAVRFRAAALAALGPDVKTVDLAGEKLSVLGASREQPLACLARQRHAYCQLGLSAGADPFSALRRLAFARGRELAGNPVAEAARSLGPGADVYFVVGAEAASDWLARLGLERAERELRFEPEPARSALRGEAVRRAAELRRSGARVEALVGALELTPGGPRLRTELRLDAAGARAVDAIFGRGPIDAGLAAWSETPAVARLLLHLRPERATAALAGLGLSLPVDAATGLVAALVLGLDTQSPGARLGAPRDPGLLPFVVPTALAVGLRRPLSAPERAGLAGLEAAGVEVRTASTALLLGAGTGSGAAAERRWRASEGRGIDDRTRLVELGLDLGALGAAFAAGVFDDDTRPELVGLERLHRRIAPGLARFRRVTLGVAGDASRRRLRLELRTEPTGQPEPARP